MLYATDILSLCPKYLLLTSLKTRPCFIHVENLKVIGGIKSTDPGSYDQAIPVLFHLLHHLLWEIVTNCVGLMGTFHLWMIVMAF